MKEQLLDFLRCAQCHQSYELRRSLVERNEVMEGELTCDCGTFPIVRGVPRLVPSYANIKNVLTASRFGEEWKQFSMLTKEYEEQFLSWIYPVQRDFFPNKIVLDAGCGKGRHILESKKFGAETVVGIDMSEAVDVAFANVGHMEGVHIIQADIYHLPLKPIFDYVYSIGVLHHTPDPAKSFTCITEKVRPGGFVSAWVYGREGNDWIVYLINPLRALTSRLPLFITKGIAFIFAVVLQGLLIVLYRPATHFSLLKKILPYHSYLCSIAYYSFKENFSIVFDHLLPGIAFYIRENDFRSWFTSNALSDVSITQRTGNSWRGFGHKSH